MTKQLPRILTTLCLLALPLLAQTQQTKSRPPAKPSFQTVDATINALYACISGPVGQARDWSRFHALFDPKAEIIAVQGRHSRRLSPEQYQEQNAAMLRRRGFFETELARRSQVFGGIAQVFSSYAIRFGKPDAPVVMRGVNSIQLRHDGKRWWVMGIIYQPASTQLPLPEELAGKAGQGKTKRRAPKHR